MNPIVYPKTYQKFFLLVVLVLLDFRIFDFYNLMTQIKYKCDGIKSMSTLIETLLLLQKFSLFCFSIKIFFSRFFLNSNHNKYYVNSKKLPNTYAVNNSNKLVKVIIL